MKKILFLLVSLVPTSHLLAQITYDGSINEADWGSAFASSSGCVSPGFGAGHELNALYVTNSGSRIVLGIAGNVQNNNRILIFLDTKSGGYNSCNYGRSGAPQGADDLNSGITFDGGFNADYVLSIGTNAGNTDYFFDLFTLSGSSGSGGGPNTYLGNAMSGGSLGARHKDLKLEF